MLATDIDPESDRGVVTIGINGDPDPLRLLRVAAVYGANASGKSTILHAAQALGRFIRTAGRFQSDEPIPFYEPFAGGGSAKAPVRLGTKAVIDGAVYDYEISFDDRHVFIERLDLHSPSETTNLFYRQAQTVTGQWTSDEQFQLVGREFRPNALLLSLADTLTPGLAHRIAPSLYRLLQFFDGSGSATYRQLQLPAARMAAEDGAFREWLLEQLKAADIGVTELAVKRLRRVTEGQTFLFKEFADDEEPIPTKEPTQYRLNFQHSGPDGPFTVPYRSESFGTRKIVDLAPLIYGLFAGSSSTAVFIDEIGASLHPTLLGAMVRHVNCEHRSKQPQGQLIFATHETSLIDDEARSAILRRDQVYFTEKDSAGVAKLFSLADFKERQNVNLRKRYLEGRYGAIPAVGLFPG